MLDPPISLDRRPATSDLGVVLACDHAAYRDGLARAIDAWSGLRLIAAVSNLEALPQARARKPSVLVASLWTPTFDGLELAAAIQGDPELENVRVALLGSRPDDALLVRSRTDGTVTHLDMGQSRRLLCEAILALAAERPDEPRPRVS